VIIGFHINPIFLLLLNKTVSGIAHNPHGFFEYSSMNIRWQDVSVPSSSLPMPEHPALLSGLDLLTIDFKEYMVIRDELPMH
jgi:hypothetical protein